VSFESARALADAVLYEGYVLYPYRASAKKNRFRFQFGVLAPRSFHAAGGCEEHRCATEILIEADGATPDGGIEVRGKVRCLQLRRRSVERWDGRAFTAVESFAHGDDLWVSWDEAIEREIDFAITPEDLRARGGEHAETIPFALRGSMDESLIRDGDGRDALVLGRVVRHARPVEGTLTVSCAPRGAGLFAVRVEIDNGTPYDVATLDREDALRASLLGAHVMLHAERGAFVSTIDPPEHARAHAEACENVRLYPVLVGRPGARDTVLAAPVVLYDGAAIAPESLGDFCDGLEIDELLTLRTMTLTEAEKREARATDARAAAIVARADGITGEGLAKLHGAVRARGTASRAGTRVRLRLGRRRSDAQDMFLDGRTATIEEEREDFEGNRWIGVLLEEDPATELHRWHGRHLWFHADEIEPLEAS
jgi:hypothetical protein